MSAFSSAKLGDLTEILSGCPFDSEFFGDDGEMSVIRIRDVVRGFSTTKYSGSYDPKYIVHDGDILIGMDGEFNRARWRSSPALLNQRVCKLSAATNKLDEGYLFHFLPRALKAIEDETPFVTVKHLSVKSILGISIPLPPLPEQRRIAEILDKAEALRAKRRAALAKLDSLAQSIFMDMFGDPESRSWQFSTIEYVADPAKGSIRTGPFGSQLLHSEFVDHGVAVLGIDNAVRNEFQWGERRYITAEKYRDLSRYKVYPGDILITIMGTCGRCAIVPSSIPEAINTKHLCCITLDPVKVLPEFVHSYFLKHPIVLKYLGNLAKGAIMDGLNMGIIKSMPIPLPPLLLQQAFARRIEAIEALKERHRASLAKLDALFVSLQHRAFRGEL